MSSTTGDDNAAGDAAAADAAVGVVTVDDCMIAGGADAG